jgi:hypothetical protein
MNFDMIVSNDFKADPYVFSSVGRRFYDCYKNFVCPECGIFDWCAATKNGINAVPKLPAKMPDFFVTFDLLAIVVSNKTKITMTEIKGCEADFYPIPNYDGYYVMLPKRIIFPPQILPFRKNPRAEMVDDPNPEVRNSPFCIDKYPCKKCGQFYNIYPNWNLYIVPEYVTFAGIFLGENGLDLVASRIVSEQLQKAKLKGMRIRKNVFANAKNK